MSPSGLNNPQFKVLRPTPLTFAEEEEVSPAMAGLDQSFIVLYDCW